MKKSIIAIAVGAALAAAGAAQAEIKVYGQVFMSIDSLNNGDKSTIALSSNESRLGFKATEEIEGGLKVNAQYETGVNLDNESTITVWDRDKFINLEGGFGKFQLGYFNSPMKMVGRNVDLFPGYVGDSRNIINEDTNNRIDSLMYVTPNMGGASVAIMFRPEDSVEDSTVINLVGEWKDDQYYAGLGYESQSECFAKPAVAAVGTTPATPCGAEAQTAIRAGFSAKFGDAKATALVQQVTDRDGTKDKSRMAYGIGGAYKIGSGTVKAQVYMMPEYDKTSDDTEATMFAVGYDHALSKTTTIYAAVAQTSNGDKGKASAFGAGHNNHDSGSYRTIPVAGESPRGISLGINHSF